MFEKVFFSPIYYKKFFSCAVNGEGRDTEQRLQFIILYLSCSKESIFYFANFDATVERGKEGKGQLEPQQEEHLFKMNAKERYFNQCGTFQILILQNIYVSL